MSDLPQHPDGPDVGGEPSPASSGRRYVWWLLGTALVIAFVVLHLTGVVGPDSN